MAIVKTEAREINARGYSIPITGKVKTTAIGMLVCIEHNTGWCEDIEDVVRRSYDADSMWKEFEERSLRRVYVPLLPNDWSIFGYILLDYVTSDILKAYMWNPAKTLPTGMSVLDSEDGEVLGLVSRGDGRMALRSMIVEWLLLRDLPAPTRCTSMRHSSNDEWQIQTAVEKDEREKMAHIWCLRWYNKCARCTLVEGPGSSFDPDLIPDF